MRKTVASLASGDKARAYRTWHEHVLARSALLTSMRRTALALARTSERRAFLTWCDQAQQRTGLLTSMRRTAIVFVGAEIVRALRTWQEAALMLANAKRAGLRLRKVGAIRALNTWRARRAESLEASRLLLRTATRFAADPLAIALDVWRAHAHHLRVIAHRIAVLQPDTRQTHDALRQWRALALQRRVSQQIAYRWLHAGLAASVRTWAAHAASWRAARVTAGRMLRSGCLRALRHWRGLASPARGARAMAYRLLGRETALALDRWRDFARSMHFARSSARRIANSAAVRALRHWGDVTSEQASARRVLSRALKSLVRRDEARCFRALVAHAEEGNAERARLVAAARRWASPALSAALRAWIQLTVHRLIGQRSVVRMLKLALARAWGTWSAAATEAREARTAMRRALSFFSNDGVARALRTWHAASAKLPLLRSALAALAHRPVSRAWRAWVEWADLRSDAVGRASRVLRHVVHHEQYRAFGTWQAASAWRGIGRRAVRRWQRQHLAHGLLCWRTSYVERLKSAGRRMSNQALLRTSLLRLHHQEENEAFQAWASHARARSHALASLRRLMRRGQMRGERLGFAALRASRERSNFFRRCMARWRHADLTAAMLAWFKLTASQHELLGRLRKAGAIWLHKERSAAFFAWRGVAHVATQRLHVLRRAVIAWRRQEVSRAFHALLVHAAERASALALARRALATLRGNGAARALRTWASLAEQRRHTLRFVSRVGRLAELRALNSWKALAADRRELLARFRVSADLLSGRGLASSLAKWRVALAEQRVLQLLVTRMLLRDAGRAFATWRHAATSDLPQDRMLMRAGGLMAVALGLKRAFLAVRTYAALSKQALVEWEHTWLQRQSALANILVWSRLRDALHTLRRMRFEVLMRKAAVDFCVAAQELNVLRRGFAAFREFASTRVHLSSWLRGPWNPTTMARLYRTLRTWQWHHEIIKATRQEVVSTLGHAASSFASKQLYTAIRFWGYWTIIQKQKRAMMMAPPMMADERIVSPMQPASLSSSRPQSAQRVRFAASAQQQPQEEEEQAFHHHQYQQQMQPLQRQAYVASQHQLRPGFETPEILRTTERANRQQHEQQQQQQQQSFTATQQRRQLHFGAAHGRHQSLTVSVPPNDLRTP